MQKKGKEKEEYDPAESSSIFYPFFDNPLAKVCF